MPERPTGAGHRTFQSNEEAEVTYAHPDGLHRTRDKQLCVEADDTGRVPAWQPRSRLRRRGDDTPTVPRHAHDPRRLYRQRRAARPDPGAADLDVRHAR